MITILLSVALALTPIPRDFLITEPAARVVDPDGEQWWKISDKLSKPLQLNPCGRKGGTGDGRTAMRTITYGNTAPSHAGEQLVLFKNVTTAKTALVRLRADVKRCAKHKEPPTTAWTGITAYRYVTGRAPRVGDDALFVSGQIKERGRRGWNELEGYLVARKGSALMIYTADWEFSIRKKVTGQAKKMAAKVCDLPGVCVSRAAP